MQTFLTTNELEYMTGYKWPRCQQKWLLENGITFYVNRFGRPIVVREVINQVKDIRKAQEPTPDFEALEALNGNN